MKLFRRGTRADPSLCDKDFLFLRALSRSLSQALNERCRDSLRDWVILDVGSTWKPYQALFAGRYRRFFALDLEAVRGHLLDVVGSAGSIPIRSSSVDCCLCTQVLEHVEDPVAVLTELARVLRPGGLLLLSTHGVFHHHPYPHDYWRWTHEGLAKMLSQFYTSVEVRANGGTMQVLFHVIGRGIYHLGERHRAFGFLRYSLYPLINLLGLVADALIADDSLTLNYLAIASRPAVFA